MLSFDGLSKNFGYHTVLDNISAKIEKGDFISLAGANGSGKSTLVRILSGILKPTKGKINYSNRKSIHLIGHSSMLYNKLSAVKNLELFAKLTGQYSNSAIHHALKWVGLNKFANQTIDSFSAGMKQRLALTRCYLMKPALLLLDEPFTNLDLQGQALLTDVLSNKGYDDWALKSALLVDHNIDRATKLSNTLWLLKSKVLEIGEPGGLFLKEVKSYLENAI